MSNQASGYVMRRLFFAVFIALVPLALVAGCSKKPSPKNRQTLNLNIGVNPRTLDPRVGGDNHSAFLIRFLFDGLMRIDEAGKPVCALAKQIDISDDHRTYTFHLRDAKWSNGAPITAHDFVYSWKSVLNPKFMTDFTYELYPIRGAKAASLGEGSLDDVGVTALDERTLVVELERPTAYFLESVAHTVFMPICSESEKRHPHWMTKADKYFVTSGAFFLDTWRHSDELVLKKSPTYWGKDQVRLERVQCFMVDNHLAQLDMFKNGEIDWVGDPCFSMPKELMYELKSEVGLTFFETPGVSLVNFNTIRGITTNLNIRKALSLAIDRTAIAEQVTQSQEMPWTSLLPPSLALQQEPYFPLHDPKEARTCFDKGLAELGMTREDLKPLRLMFAGSTGKTKFAETLQQQWEEALGITVHLDNFEWKVFFDYATTSEYDTCLWSWTSELNDPVYNLEVFKDRNSLNLAKWHNPKFSAILKEAASEIDQAKRLELLHKAERVLLSEMPVAPITDCKDHFICSKKLKGIVISKMGLIDMRMAYIEEGEEGDV